MRTVSIVRNFAIAILCIGLAASSCTKESDSQSNKLTSDEVVAANIAKYSRVWDSIINTGDLDLFNSTNFSPNVVFHMKPNNVVGIDGAPPYYANYLTGFSNIKFEIVDIFGRVINSPSTGCFRVRIPAIFRHSNHGLNMCR